MQWNVNLAYAVGLIASDGCLSKDGRHIDLTSTDIDQIQTFARILKLSNKISTNQVRIQSRKYVIGFSSVV